MDRSKPPAETLRNYDPKRSYKETDIYLSVEVSDANGIIGTVLMPEAQVRNKTDEEIAAATAHAVFIMDLATQCVDPKKLKSPALLQSVSGGLIEIATALIAINMIDVYLTRKDQGESVSVSVEVDDIPESEGERDDLALNAIWANTITRTKPIVEAVFQVEEMTERFCESVWHTMFSYVLFEIDDLQGINSFLSMTGKEQGECFDKRLDARFVDYLDGALSFQAQGLARMALDLLNPSALPIEKLRAYIGVEVSVSDATQEAPPQIIKVKDASRLLRLFARRNPAADIEIKPLGDRLALLLPAEFQEKFNELLLQGAVAEDFFREGNFTKEERRKYLPKIARELAKRNTKPTKQELGKLLGVSPGTIHAYLEDDPELKTIIMDAFVNARLDIPE